MTRTAAAGIRMHFKRNRTISFFLVIIIDSILSAHIYGSAAAAVTVLFLMVHLSKLKLKVYKFSCYALRCKQGNRNQHQYVHWPPDKELLFWKCLNHVTAQRITIVEGEYQYGQHHAYGGKRRQAQAYDSGLQIIKRPFYVPEKSGNDPHGILYGVCPEEDPSEAQEDESDWKQPPVPAALAFRTIPFLRE